MGNALTTIQKFMQSLDHTTLKGKDAIDEAVRASSRFNSTDEWINSFTALVREYNTTNTNNYTSNNDFLKSVCNINLSNKDTGAITGLDAGGPVEKTAETVVPEPPRSIQDPAPGSSSSFQGLTVIWPKSGTSGLGFTEAEKTVMRGLQTWWISEGLSLIQESFGLNFNGNNATVKEMPIFLEFNQTSGNLAFVESLPDYERATNKISMTINMAFYDSLDPNNPNGYSPKNDKTYLDRIIAHELTHAVTAATVDYFSLMPRYVIEGLAEIVHGIDDMRLKAIDKLCNSPDKLAAALTYSSENSDIYAGGYMALRYLAKNGGRPFAPTATQYLDPANANNLIITSSNNDQIWLDGRNNITYAGINNLDARNASGSLILAGNANANIIVGSNGSSSLWGGNGNVSDSLYGGNGTDSFFYGQGEGNDVIVNGQNIDKVMAYTPRFDYAITNTSVNGDTLSISMNDGGSLTVLGWNENALNTFELANKTKWGYSIAANKWIQK